jgi:nucleotide-binding universal stress UspA family protein
MKHTVVAGYDRTDPSERALIEAGREAAWRGASLTVVHAFRWIPAATPMAYPPLSVEQSMKEAAEEVATDGADLARYRFPETTVEAEAIEGQAAEVLATASRDADLLVVGNRGRGGFAGQLLGSVSMRALASSDVPTMVVRGPEHGPHGLIVVAVDLEEPTDGILGFAFAEASRRGVRLEAVTVWDMPWALELVGDAEEVETAGKQAMTELDAALESAMAALRAEYPDVHADHEVVDGMPGTVLNAASQQADLVLVGAHRHGGGRHGMRVGPVAHALLHHADCPVIVVPLA